MNDAVPPLAYARERTIADPTVATVAACMIALFAGTAALTLGLSLGGDAAERWLLAARYTARVSFAVFLPFYVAPALPRWSAARAARALRRQRVALGLAFAVTHTIHLAALTTHCVVARERPEPAALVVGGGAYVVLYLMVATTGAARRAPERSWRPLHALGPDYLWFVFALSYCLRLMTGDLFWAPFVALAAGALVLRVGARRAPAEARLRKGDTR